MAQKEFINIAAHELRNPIQPILALSDVLQRSDILWNILCNTTNPFVSTNKDDWIRVSKSLDIMLTKILGFVS